LKERFSISI